MEERQRVKLFIGSGEVEERGKKLIKELENAGYRVVIVPISDEGVLEFSSGGYMYSGYEIDVLENILEEMSEKNTREHGIIAAT